MMLRSFSFANSFFLMLFLVNIFKETGFGGNYYSQSVLKCNLSQLCGHPYFYFGQSVVYGKLDSFDVASFLPKWSISLWQKTEKFKTHWHNWMAFNNLFSCIVVILWLTQKKWILLDFFFFPFLGSCHFIPSTFLKMFCALSKFFFQSYWRSCCLIISVSIDLSFYCDAIRPRWRWKLYFRGETKFYQWMA